MCDPVGEDTGDPLGDVAGVELRDAVNTLCVVEGDLSVVDDVLSFGKDELSGEDVGDGRVVDSFIFL